MPTVHVTPEAAASITELQAEYGGPGWGLRFGLTGGGCSGYKYVIEFEEHPAEGDYVLEQDGFVVFLSPADAEKLDGATIDWEDTLMSSGFKIDNPHAKNACGCGESIDF